MASNNENSNFIQRTAEYWFLAVPALAGVFIFILGFVNSLVAWKDVFFGVGGTIFGRSISVGYR